MCRGSGIQPCVASENWSELLQERSETMIARKVRSFRTMIALALTAMLMLGVMGTALAYTFPSTNDFNRDNNLPHVNQVDVGIGEVTLEFKNETNSLAFFEYRIDGATVGTNAHPVVTGDVIHPGICVDNRAAPVCPGTPVIETFAANSVVEVRLALGGERDWDFDWTPFYVESMTADHCKNGGFADFGFRNQGLCIQYVNTGKDSR